MNRVGHGHWWIPTASGQENNGAVMGTLSYGPSSGGRLETAGYLTDDSVRAGSELVSIEVILGDIGGQPVTLLHCAVIAKQVQVPGIDTTTILAGFVFVGCHFQSGDEVEFTRVSLSYTHLNEWMRRKSFRTKGTYEFEYVPFQKVETEFEDFRLEFAYDFNQNYKLELGSTRVSMEEFARVSVVPRKKMSWDRVYSLFATEFSSFLTLATGTPNFPLDIRGTVESSDKPVNIVCYMRDFDDNPNQVPSIYMMFTFKEVRDGLSTYLSKWIEKSGTLRSVVNLYLESVRNRTLDEHTRFLFLAQVLEAYHRDRDPEGGLYKDAKEYEPIQQALLLALDNHDLGDSQKNKLISSIRHGNEYSLTKRIRELLDELIAEYDEIADTLKEVYGKPKDFAYDVSHTRNYLTHRPKDAPKYALKGLNHTMKMQLLVRLCLLRDLGFPLNDVRYLQPNFPWR